MSPRRIEAVKAITDSGRLHVVPSEAGGAHAVHSLYVETYWLPVLGPTGLLLLRKFDRELTYPKGRIFDLDELGSALGMNGRAIRLDYALDRLVSFHAASVTPDGSLAVCRSLPTLSRALAHHLTPGMSARHEFEIGRES